MPTRRRRRHHRTPAQVAAFERLYSKIRRHQMGRFAAWTEQTTLDSMNRRADNLHVSRSAVYRAVIDAGMRHVTTSDIVRAEMRWKQVLASPAPAVAVGG